MAIANGRQVLFDYTLTVDGKIVDSSKDRGPLKYTHGQGDLIPGLTRQLEGMKIGEEKSIVVAPEEAYGAVDPAAFKEVARTTLPKNIDPQVGMFLQVQSPDGKVFPVRISELKKDSVMIDFNHPLAGKKLFFQVKVVSVQ
jgi:FKBP-type peptidyl-prolyl cis-trans isomerase 2